MLWINGSNSLWRYDQSFMSFQIVDWILQFLEPKVQLGKENYICGISPPVISTVKWMFSLIFQQLYTELQGHFFKLNSNFSEVKPESYDALIIPGGRFTELLSADDKVLGIVSNFAQAGKPIATTCHSQLLLVAAGFIKGKKCNAFPSMKPLVTLAGGVWMDPEPITSCVLDGNIISAIGWPAHAEYLNLLLRSMGAKISGSHNKAILFLCGVGFLYSSV